MLLSKVVHLCVHLQDLTLQSTVYMYVCMYTVEPPNKGQVGAWALVHYLGVVLYWGVFVKKPFLCVVSIHTLSLQITMVSLGAAVAIYNGYRYRSKDSSFHTGRSNEVSQ